MPAKKTDSPLLTPFDKEYYKKNPLAEWVWRANPNACTDCIARDGRRYMYPDAVKLKRPHPNCRCRLELASDTKSSSFITNALHTLDDVAQETGDALREIANAEAWERFISETGAGLADTFDGSVDSLHEVATSDVWGKTARGTADAMEWVWDDPAGRAALLLAGATMLPGIAAGMEAAPALLLGSMEMLPASVAVGLGSAIPYIPEATDFLSSITPYTPPDISSAGVIGTAVGFGLEYYTDIEW
ncbi:hypothetical protein [Oceanidesulfovibrio marinus]|uniref:Uncharacterized protein n=1 Tax=Oceanidesulfovibrio marinus TaxID=370038 RepID=A0A6P1ZI97_9BACT|nr:hypothetical protein [Oceanidesulfovibrio marinus]TVM33366.1 hypothetical protein DQK91_11920 [Oceanidesulfovibrio marinus]